MADVKFDRTQAAVNTSTGNQDFTISGFGTPKAVILVMNGATATDTPTTHLRLSFGFATGASNEACFTTRSEDGVGTTDPDRGTYSNSCVRLLDQSGTSFDAVGEFVSFITDGVRINWTTAPEAAYLLTVILIGGSDVSAYVGYDDGFPDNGTLDNTDVGFLADVAIVAHATYQTAINTLNTASAHGIGVATRSPSSQATWCAGNMQGVSTALCFSRLRDGDSAVSVYSGGRLWEIDISGWDSSGWTWNVTSVFGMGSASVVYLALAFNGGGVWTDIIDSATSTGTKAYTGVGFKPQFGMIFGTLNDDTTTHETGANAMVSAIGSFTASSEGCHSQFDEDGVSTTDTGCEASSSAIFVTDHGGGDAWEADLDSFDSDGFTLNYSAATTGARKWLAVMFEEAPVETYRYGAIF